MGSGSMRRRRDFTRGSSSVSETIGSMRRRKGEGKGGTMIGENCDKRREGIKGGGGKEREELRGMSGLRVKGTRRKGGGCE